MVAAPTAITKPRETQVGMGQIALVGPGESAAAILGSCIGVVLFHQQRRLAVMAHIVLAESRGNATHLPGKFADTALPAMLKMMQERGVRANELVAKLAGGAAMFGGGGPIQIGNQNYEATRSLLVRQNIPILGEHVGGTQGRKVSVLPEQSKIVIEIVGQTAAIL